MKKLLVAAVALLAFGSVNFAQTPQVKKLPATQAQVVQNAAKAKAPVVTAPAATAKTVVTTPAAKPAVAKKMEAPAAKPTAAAGVPLKKDGTPDKRYNSAKAATAPVKKDGTPDMRYKANKKN